MLPGMPAVKEVSIERVTAGASDGALARTSTQDRIVVEAPLALAARGQRVLTIMRTPGHDLELITGLLHAEALPPATITRSSASTASAASSASASAGPAAPTPSAPDDDLLDVDLDPTLFAPRALASVAACGVCGRQTIADLEQTTAAVASDFTISAQTLRHLPGTLRRTQQVFDDTGGLHAAALATATGELLVVREDVGRHNAVDKVIGYALTAKLSPSQLTLVVSGRLGYEIVQKAVRFGTPVIAAVSAPSSLAVELAERFGVALCGFVRGERFNIYSHSWRIT